MSQASRAYEVWQAMKSQAAAAKKSDDVVAAIDAALGCQHCGRAYSPEESPSDDFCSIWCQTEWHNAQVVPLRQYREPWQHDIEELSGVGTTQYRYRPRHPDARTDDDNVVGHGSYARVNLVNATWINEEGQRLHAVSSFHDKLTFDGFTMVSSHRTLLRDWFMDHQIDIGLVFNTGWVARCTIAPYAVIYTGIDPFDVRNGRIAPDAVRSTLIKYLNAPPAAFPSELSEYVTD